MSSEHSHGTQPRLQTMESSNQLTTQELLETCMECCTSFNPGQLSLDAHADTFIAEMKLVSETDCTFIRQVLYGTTRFHALLKSFVDAFYQKNRYFSIRVTVVVCVCSCLASRHFDLQIKMLMQWQCTEGRCTAVHRLCIPCSIEAV